jgi:radical SAM enzyme (TIGR01210 family)
MIPPYPESQRERDRWILARRSAERNVLDPQRPYAFLVEEERSASGEIVPVATVFLTNRECPWRCLMCDLWRNTLTETVPVGAIPAQIDHALSRLPPARQIKLYNSGSFFDPRAIPLADHAAIAERVHGFDRIIVESHPALVGDVGDVGDDCLRFRDRLGDRGDARLEIAMGLETVHPTVGPRLNKRMTLEQFAAAAEKLRREGIALRVFILVKPPFLDEAEALYWAERSLDFAMECGATVAALIPTRFGNGALEDLAERGEFSPPRLATLEAAAEYGVGLGRGRVFADLWDLERFADCPECFAERAARLLAINLRQEIPDSIRCRSCGE